MAKEKTSPSSSKATATKEKTTVKDTEIAAAVDQLYLLSALSQKDETLNLLKKVISTKGKIVRDENLGNKPLAYPINKHKELKLMSIFFEAQPAVIASIEKELSTEEEVERFLVTAWSAELPKEDTRAPRDSREDKRKED